MKKIGILFIIVVMIFGLTTLIGFSAQQEIKAQHNLVENNPWHAGFTYIVDELSKRTNGYFTGTVYPNGVLAQQDWQVILEQCQTNVIQLCCEGTGAFSNWQPEFFAIPTPYLFEDMAHFLRFMENDPPMVERWCKGLEEKDIKVIALWPRAMWQSINKVRPINKVEDFEGLLYRSGPITFFLTVFEGLGLKAVPMAFGETYTGIQLGTVDGFINPYPSIYDIRTFEIAKYITEIDLLMDAVIVIANLEWYNNLSEEHRKLLDEVARESGEIVYQAEKKYAEECLQNMIDAGCEYNKITDLEPFKAKMEPVYDFIANMVGPEWEEYIQLVEAAR